LIGTKFRWHFIRGVKLTTHLRLVPGSKNGWSCTSTPPIRLNAQLGGAQGQLYLYNHGQPPVMHATFDHLTCHKAVGI